jgi:CheY-like chemotaxis protein
MRKPQILVVEDEGLVALELKEALERMGYSVPHMAASGKEALASVIADCPDLIIMDIRLDGPIDGIETAKRVKQICPIPVIYLTADCNDATLQEATTTEAYGYILKPFEERALRAALEIALSRGRKDREDKEEREWNEIILKNLNDGILAADPKGTVSRCNDVALALLGRRREECLGKPLGKVVRIVCRNNAVPESLSVTRTIIENEAVENPDCRLLINETQSVPVAYRLAPLKNKNDNTIGAILFIKRL